MPFFIAHLLTHCNCSVCTQHLYCNMFAWHKQMHLDLPLLAFVFAGICSGERNLGQRSSDHPEGLRLRAEASSYCSAPGCGCGRQAGQGHHRAGFTWPMLACFHPRDWEYRYSSQQARPKNCISPPPWARVLSYDCMHAHKKHCMDRSLRKSLLWNGLCCQHRWVEFKS